MKSVRIVEVADYWPEVAADLSLVSWSHATNSQAELAAALQDGTMMIEADVSMGPGGEPIMAHPPATQSDLTLQQFLDTVIAETERGTRKGIKLDFKAIEIVQPSLEMLQRVESRLNFPVWLNADIIEGPGGGPPVEADTFLALCAQYFPGATLSTGFTTGLGLLGHYTEQQLRSLYTTLVAAGTSSPVTVPIRASLGARSVEEILQFLLAADSDALFPVTLTIWSASLDLVDMAGLEELVLAAGKDRVYVDVPWDYVSPPGQPRTPKPRGTGGILSTLHSVINFVTSSFFM